MTGRFVERPAFLAGEARERAKRWRPIEEEDPPAPLSIHLHRADRQAALILIVAIIGLLAYWRGHEDGSKAERISRSLHGDACVERVAQ